MVNAGRSFQLAALLLAAVSSHSVLADFPAWQIGDTADHDITAPVTLDVIDAQATAARRTEESLKTAMIFRGYTSVTNTMVVKFGAAFDESRSNFLAGLQQQFHQPALDAAEVKSPAFTEFVEAFNENNPKLPVSPAIASQWAQGEGLEPLKGDYAGKLLLATRRPVTLDILPAGFEPAGTVRLVPVRVAKEPLTLEQAQRRGKLVTHTNFITVTQLRSQFRRDFSPDDQNFARALANFIHPNCDVDTNLTTEARERATAPIVVAYHYDAGQLIVRRGQKVDSRIQATLQRLAETTAATLPRVTPAASPAPAAAVPVAQANPRSDLVWWWGAVPAVLILAAAVWIWKRKTKPAGQLMPLQPVAPAVLPAELAPQLVQILKTAVVQELAAQRQELLQTQHTAAAEVVRLMQRLNELHAPMQDRLGAYERRIQELEMELTLRKEENRELLKMKIELLRQQLEAERVVSRQTGFN